jgi:hypothetical protein
MVQLDQDQSASLIAFLDERCVQQGCDYSRRFCREWAMHASYDWDDLVDILDHHGAFCDCEAVLNLPEGIKLVANESVPASPENKWRLPASFIAAEGDAFSKVIVCEAAMGSNTHASQGELLVPAPKGAQSRKRVRKLHHFFVGCESGLPAEVGVVAECPAISAEAFALRVADTGFPEFQDFTYREAAFVLSRVASLPPGAPVGTHFMEVAGISAKREELRVHKVICRRR